MAPAARPGEPSARRPVRLALVAALAFGGVLLYRFDPESAGFFPPCLFHAATGLACPGCGSTRALHALLHLDLGAAFRLNPLLFVLPLAGGLWLASEKASALASGGRIRRAAPVLLALLVVAFTVWRNLPEYPFARLSSGLKAPFAAEGG